jgi:hypothetical protein
MPRVKYYYRRNISVMLRECRKIPKSLWYSRQILQQGGSPGLREGEGRVETAVQAGKKQRPRVEQGPIGGVGTATPAM